MSSRIAKSFLVVFTCLMLISLPRANSASEVPPASIGSGFSEVLPNPNFLQSTINGYTPLQPGKVGQGNHPLCQSATDPHCTSTQSITAQVIAPPCVSPADVFCVEGLSVSNTNGEFEKATLAKELDNGSSPAYEVGALPRGGSASVWQTQSKHQGGANQYGVVLKAVYSADTSKLKFQAANFTANVYPVNKVLGNYCTYEIYEVKDNFDEFNTTSRPKTSDCIPAFSTDPVKNCILTDVGACYTAQQFIPDAKVSLKVRIDNRLTGWLFGRMKDPNISITPLNSTTNSLEVSATSLNLMSAKGWVKKSDIKNYPLLYQDVTTKWFLKPEDLTNFFASDATGWGDMAPVGSFHEFAMWEPLLKAEAKDNWSWNFGSTSWNNSAANSSCMETLGRKKLVGLVTTNSPIYEGGSPSFASGFLQYKVAGLHTWADGSLFKGTYDLVMDSQFARCLYGFTSAPISANIAILASDGSQTNVATEVVSEKNNWISLVARNFTFSSPTIKVKLFQDVVGTKILPNAKKDLKASITCIKGKINKKIEGLNPKCPKGWIQK